MANNEQHPLTIDYIQNVLREFEQNNTLDVLNMTSRRILSFGEHFTGEVFRFKINYEMIVDGQATRSSKSVIVKLPVPDDVNVPPEIFSFESRVYNNVLGTLENVLKQKLPVIRSIKAEEDVVVTEDFKDDGWVFPKLRQGLNQKQSIQVIKSLAMFHAASIIMSKYEDSPFTRLSQHVQDQVYCESNADICKKTLADSYAVAKHFADEYLPRANEDEAAVITKFFSESSDDLYNKAKRVIAETPDSRKVFVHGECWAHNFMLKEDNSGEHALLINIATVCLASPVRDLVYLFATNPQTINRRPLLKIYDEELLKHLHAHKLPKSTIEKFSIESIQSEIDRFKPVALLTAIWLLVAMSYTSYPSLQEYNRLPREEKPQLVARHIDKEFYVHRLMEILLEYVTITET